jgi:hypothetical protein
MMKRGVALADDTAQAKSQAEVAWRQQAKKRILSNALSAAETQKDLLSAQAAGARGMGDVLANRSNAKNAKRDFMNKLLRENEWPGLYWAEIPTADLRTGKVQLTWVPFLLPHEWLPLYTRWEESLDDLEPEEDYMRSARQRLAKTLHADPHKLVVLGLHGDGVPIGGTMAEESLDVFNVNMPTSRKHASMRIPFACIQLKHTVPETFEAIVKILCWSMRCLAAGVRPQTEA